MTAIDTAPGVKPIARVDSTAFLWALLGAAAYGWLVFGVLAQADAKGFGWSIYDEAFLAYLDGQLDLPARVLRFEGHFTPDGYGYIYHGLAPLLTRLVFAPFVDITTTPLGPFSIWFWSALGSAFYHASFFRVAGKAWPETGRNAHFWSALLAVAVWGGGPGLIMASNLALYQEPIAVAYALSGGVVFLWARAVTSGLPIRCIVVGMALLGALAVHARPNVAVGLYAVVLAASVLALWQDRGKAILPCLVAVMLLGAGGGSYLAFNKLRFGASATTHGTFSEGPVQHAMTFWGFEAADSARADAFAKHGRFNAGRVLPNVVYYTIEPPQNIMPAAYLKARDAYGRATSGWLGHIRIEGPGAGIAFMWAGWAFLATAGLFAGRSRMKPWAGLLLGSGISALVTLSYATITLRYHVDLWPLVAVLAILGLARLTPAIVAVRLSSAKPLAIIAVAIFGLKVNMNTALDYRDSFAETPGSFKALWSQEACADLADAKGFSPERMTEICRSPRTHY